MNKTLLIAAAFTGLMSVAYAADDAKTPAAPAVAAEAMGECHGNNACKGKGDCGGKGNACAGKNSCKGKGWMKSSKAECSEKKGKFTAAKPAKA